MRKLLGGIGVSLFLTAVVSYAQSEQSVPLSANDSPTAWFVELKSPPTIEGSNAAALDIEEGSFHAAAAAAGIRYSESRHFRKLFNGLTVRASAREVARLR